MTKTKQPAFHPQITVSGVTFSAEQVKSAVVTIDGRDIFIGERAKETPKLGFPAPPVSHTQKGS